MARLEPSGTLVLTKEVRRLYDLPVFTAAGTLSATSGRLPQPSKNQGLDIQIDRHKVANTAAQYKTVPNGVAEANALRGIENHAQRV